MQSARFYQLAMRVLIAAVTLWPPASQPAVPRPDAPAIAQLRAGKIEELERQFSLVQADYRRGAIDDERLYGKFWVFFVDDATLEPRFDLWIQRYPDSYGAYLARGIHRTQLGLQARGTRLARDTTEKQWIGMRRHFQEAMDDLRKSMQLDARPLLSYLFALTIEKNVSDGGRSRQLLDDAVMIDPKNVVVRREYLVSLQTRWGGSPQAMREFAGECREQGLPEPVVRDFLGQAELDAGWLQHREKRLEEAEASFRAALTLLADPNAAWKSLGFVLTDEHKYLEAVDVLSKVLEKDPNDSETLSRRGGTYMALKQPAPGLADFQRAADLGDAYAQNELGKRYWHGIAVAKDPQQAIAWFKKAADQGNADAKNNLSWALRQTAGLPH